MLHSFFRSVFTFKFNSITSSDKAALAYNSFCIPYLLEGPKFYQYTPIPGSGLSLSSTIPNPFKSSDGFKKCPNPPLKHINIWRSILFKPQILLLNGKFHAIFKVKNLANIKKYTQTLTFFLRNSSFPPAPYCLKCFRSFLLSANVVSQISLLYGCLPFERKCTMY